ncbi:unnamed protein product [Coregonus sp. 'balchen']|nr:unnamed protein product [Coregonus sp. 'balchen']
MPECQYVRPEACGSSWRLCHLALPESMARMPTAVACPGGSRTVIGRGQEQGYLPDQANLPMHQDFGPQFSSHPIRASLFQTLCPMSGAYMPVKPSDHRCCQAAPDVILPHYALINSPTHGVASCLFPAPSSMQPQGFAYDPVHMYGPHSESVNAMSSTFNVRAHARHQQETAEHCREPSNMPMGENPNEQNYSVPYELSDDNVSLLAEAVRVAAELSQSDQESQNIRAVPEDGPLCNGLLRQRIALPVDLRQARYQDRQGRTRMIQH